MTLDYDLGDPATRANPFPLLHRLQEEAPVLWSERLGGWLVTRYADVRRAVLDKEFSADRVKPFFRALPEAQRGRYPELERYISRWAVFFDPPGHTRLRRLLNLAFTPRAVAAMRPRIAELAEDLLDAAPRGDSIDLIRDFAYPLPASVIMVMLGAPREALASVKRWSDDMALFIGSAKVTADKYERAEAGMRDMAAYFSEIIAERRARPQDDLISAMLGADAGGDRLDDDELIASCSLLLFAGHETTTNLIGNGAWALATHPAEQARLRAEPALLESAVEEMLRWDGPSLAAVRVVAVDCTLGDQTLKAGQRVFAMLTAANRDPRVFPDPDRFDAGRLPNRHLTFGAGLHFCLGAPLARLEGQIAIATLLRRFAEFRLEAERLDWMDSLTFRGVRALPLAVRMTA